MKALLSLSIIFAAGAGAPIFWWNQSTQPPSQDQTPHPFIIPKGRAAVSIAENLEEEGFIKSALAFKIYVQVKGQAGKIQAGDYRLSKNQPLPSLVGELVHGPIAVWVTLQEGLRREEIAVKIAGSLTLTDDKKEVFATEFLTLTKNNEGLLFPDTYLFLTNSTPRAVAKRLTENFDAKITPDIKNGFEKQNLTLEKGVTLASIVERETRTDEERPIVAGILLKRLKIGMALQADATLQYIVGSEKCEVGSEKCEWWPVVTTNDKKIKSPYNTYTNRGLPPRPIANPGLSSIKAVANPEDSPYWYYLHDREGKIHYAETPEVHGENIRKYLR